MRWPCNKNVFAMVRSECLLPDWMISNDANRRHLVLATRCINAKRRKCSEIGNRKEGGGQKTGEREEMAVTLRDHRKRTWVDGKRGTRRQFDGGSWFQRGSHGYRGPINSDKLYYPRYIPSRVKSNGPYSPPYSHEHLLPIPAVST